MREPYPPIEPRRAGWLDVGQGHEVWFEDCGAPSGLPVVFLHGGPGSGCKPSHRQFFDPGRYRIVLFDQRGCGRSRPLGGVQANTTHALVADLEQLRAALGIDRWVLFGGSWGATLALVYAATFPARVAGMVLRGSFLARPSDVDWFFHDGASRLFPLAWERLRSTVPPQERGQLLAALYRRVFGTDPAARDVAMRAWVDWGGTVALANMPADPGPAGLASAAREPTLASPSLAAPSAHPTEAATIEAAGPMTAAGPRAATAPPAADDPLAPARLLASTRIELHYAAARYFVADDPILACARRCPRVPTFIVHGERDFTCVPESALALHAAMPWADLRMLPGTGHLANEPRMTDALLTITDCLPELLA